MDARSTVSVWRLTVPSWSLSVALHILFLFVLATTLKSCGHAGPGEGDSDFREVGIYVKDADVQEDRPETEDAVVSETDTAVEAQTSMSSEASPDSTAVADLLELPKVDSARIGPGAIPPMLTPGDVGQIKPTGSQPRLMGGGGRTSFFDIADTGTRFVYVLDRSGSMSNHNAVRVAKNELIASLEHLDATQQFQIVFYNQTARELKIGTDELQLYWATEYNKTAARQFIAGIEPSGGTLHAGALRGALKLRPDVIFFLTDADDELIGGDVTAITQLNRGTRIHCIEFGNGPALPVDNFLKKLARDNDGSYRYCDTSSFTRK